MRRLCGRSAKAARAPRAFKSSAKEPERAAFALSERSAGAMHVLRERSASAQQALSWSTAGTPEAPRELHGALRALCERSKQDPPEIRAPRELCESSEEVRKAHGKESELALENTGELNQAQQRLCESPASNRALPRRATQRSGDRVQTLEERSSRGGCPSEAVGLELPQRLTVWSCPL